MLLLIVQFTALLLLRDSVLARASLLPPWRLILLNFLVQALLGRLLYLFRLRRRLILWRRLFETNLLLGSLYFIKAQSLFMGRLVFLDLILVLIVVYHRLLFLVFGTLKDWFRTLGVLILWSCWGLLQRLLALYLLLVAILLLRLLPTLLVENNLPLLRLFIEDAANHLLCSLWLLRLKLLLLLTLFLVSLTVFSTAPFQLLLSILTLLSLLLSLLLLLPLLINTNAPSIAFILVSAWILYPINLVRAFLVLFQFERFSNLWQHILKALDFILVLINQCILLCFNSLLGLQLVFDLPDPALQHLLLLSDLWHHLIPLLDLESELLVRNLNTQLQITDYYILNFHRGLMGLCLRVQLCLQFFYPLSLRFSCILPPLYWLLQPGNRIFFIF